MPESSERRIEDALFAFELGGSIGGSLDPAKNCKAFCDTLLARRNFAFASVWVDDELLATSNGSKGYSLMFATPAVRAVDSWVSRAHPAFNVQRPRPGLSISSDSAQYAQCVNELGAEEGVLTVLRLGSVGWLKLLSYDRDPLSRRELSQLDDIGARLATALEGAIAHQRLVTELDERRRLATQLRRAQKFEAIAQLTAGIAHDFNNLLTSILGFNQLAHLRFGQQGNDELDEYLDEIKDAGGRARSLVSKLLTFTRNEGTEQVEVSLGECVADALRLLRPMIPSTVEIEVEQDADAPLVLANSDEISQIVLNLCLNARDAMAGRGAMSVRVGKVEDGRVQCASCLSEVEGVWVSLAVGDSGPGLTPATRERMFDPFFTTKGEHGSGLGLSMVHGLVHSHQGHIQVRSATNQGTTIEVILPAVDASSMAVESN